MSKRVARANGSPAATHAAPAPHLWLERSSLETRKSLLQSAAIAQCRPDVGVVEADGNHGDQEDRESQEQGEPEVSSTEGHAQATQVLVAYEVAVDEESHSEVEGHGSPDDHVIEDGPVGGVQCDLCSHHQDEDRRDYGSEDLVAIQVDALWSDGVAEGSVWNEEDDEGRDDAVSYALQELDFVEEQVSVTWGVEERVASGEAVVDVLVEGTECQDGKRGVEDVVERDEGRIVQRLSER